MGFLFYFHHNTVCLLCHMLLFYFHIHFFLHYREEKEVMGGAQLEFVQLTQGVDYFLEHMAVLFLHAEKHRFGKFSFVAVQMLSI